jgi:hypothetical protein
VLSDRIVVVPEQGDDRQPQQIPISPQLAPEEVGAVVKAVQKEVNYWGLAVANGYWKPVLQIEVEPGAERQYEDLHTALQGSGFDMQRKIR